MCPCSSLIIKDLFYEAKAKTFSQGQDQGQIFKGQLRRLPLQAKICIAVTKTEYAYLKYNAKETICDSFGV